MGLWIKVKTPFLGHANSAVMSNDVRLAWLLSDAHKGLVSQGFEHFLIGIEITRGPRPDYYVFRMRDEDFILARLLLDDLSPMMEDRYFDLRIANNRQFFRLHEFDEVDLKVGLREYFHGTYFNSMARDEYEQSLWTTVNDGAGTI